MRSLSSYQLQLKMTLLLVAARLTIVVSAVGSLIEFRMLEWQMLHGVVAVLFSHRLSKQPKSDDHAVLA